jgi:nucleotide-binding universal stress UspA family protein
MKILVPTDFSENAINAFEFAKKITKRNNGTMTLLFSYSTIYDFAGQAEKIVNEIETTANNTLKNEINASHNQDVLLDYKIIQGSVATEVLSTAYQEDYDLIIMGTQGASGIEQALIGSNTVDVIKASKIPVLAVPFGANYELVREITVAVELATDEEQIFPPLMRLTKNWNLPYKILHIENGGTKVKGIAIIELEKHLKRKFPDVAFSYTSFQAKNTIEGINHYLKKSPDSLLVMFSKNKTFFEYLFDRSQVVKMSYHTHVPLLVLKSPTK